MPRGKANLEKYGNAAMDSFEAGPTFSGHAPTLPQIGAEGPNLFHTKKIRKGSTTGRKRKKH
jgi:hypothetical protein